jgi:Zn-dependent protease with chaperone function
LFNNNLVIAISIGTIAGKFFMLKLFPILKNRFLEKDAEFPADKTDLKNKIIKLAEELGYDNAEAKIRLYQSASGDLHSNASVDGSKINISYRLLTHHEGKDEELLAILAHELGHWS